MNKKYRLYFLKNQLTAIVIILGIIMMGFGILLYINHTDSIRINTIDRLVRTASDNAQRYGADLEGEHKKLYTLAMLIEEIDITDTHAIETVLDKYLRETGEARGRELLIYAADGTPIYGRELAIDKHKSMVSALRGNKGTSYVQGLGVVFSYPVIKDGNVKYVLYELFSEEAFMQGFPPSKYEGRSKSLLMTHEGEIVVPFNITDNDENGEYLKSSTLRVLLQNQIRKMDSRMSSASDMNSEIGRVYLYVAEVENTDFVYAGIISEEKIASGIVGIPRLVLTVFLLLVLMVIALAMFLIVASQRITESEALKEAKQAAEDANRAKSDFLANMSHEIRTPINTILGMNEMILREYTDPTLIKYAVSIKKAGKSLLGQINDVLDFSRIEAGKMELFEDKYNLAEVISDVVDMVIGAAESKGLYLDTVVNENIPEVLFGDSLRIRQVIQNLLTNAIKYTDHGGVELSFDYEKLDAINIRLDVSVKDTGISIKDEDLNKLFVAFERFDEDRNKTIEGTGLGMNIVYRLLGMMGSRPRVKSVYGEGSTFSFSIVQKVIDQTPIGDYRDHIDDKKLIEVYQSTFKAPEGKLLVVDDTDMNLVVIQGLLKGTDLCIDTAMDGRQALLLASKREYDVLLVDHRMPVMDGMEMIRSLRGNENNPNRNKPVIALTANAVAGAREEYLRAGFDDYLVKPVNGQRLEEMLLKYLPIDKVSLNKNTEQTKVEIQEEPKLIEQRDEGISIQNELLKAAEANGYLNTADGIEYSGNEELYLVVLKLFVESIESKSNEIRQFYEDEAWEDYRTRVHALKSSARVIGARELSKEARDLEIAANEK
ncbi:MAG: response regulator, partial [Lachnospiraceae bacterium]|nr:response regulator [Lachnospiraceae bacterium]